MVNLELRNNKILVIISLLLAILAIILLSVSLNDAYGNLPDASPGFFLSISIALTFTFIILAIIGLLPEKRIKETPTPVEGPDPETRIEIRDDRISEKLKALSEKISKTTEKTDNVDTTALESSDDGRKNGKTHPSLKEQIKVEGHQSPSPSVQPKPIEIKEQEQSIPDKAQIDDFEKNVEECSREIETAEIPDKTMTLDISDLMNSQVKDQCYMCRYYDECAFTMNGKVLEAVRHKDGMSSCIKFANHTVILSQHRDWLGWLKLENNEYKSGTCKYFEKKKEEAQDEEPESKQEPKPGSE